MHEMLICHSFIALVMLYRYYYVKIIDDLTVVEQGPLALFLESDGSVVTISGLVTW